MITEEIGAEIAAAREEKNLSIDDIAAATRINADYLQKIEQGEFDFLPRPYVIAYVKTFAGKVGLDGDELVKRWEDAEAESVALETEAPAISEDDTSGKQVQPTVAEEKASDAASAKKTEEKRRFKEFGIGAGVIAVLAFIFYIANDSGQNETIQDADKQAESGEIPISDVIAENEARMDSIAAAIPEISLSSEEATQPFTLKLEASDTVWIRLAIDGMDSREYLFMPGRSGTWQANEYIIIRTGNAGATHLFRNDAALNPLGALGQVRRFRITHNEMRRE
ncbi:MAG: helix-turn-helix domain-containing protein [bacterium]